jgi:hypothetical protein
MGPEVGSSFERRTGNERVTERKGQREKALGSWLLASLLALGPSLGDGWAFAQSSPTAGAPDATPQPVPGAHAAPHTRLSITLRVYNYAHLDSTLLTSTQEVATAIFKAAGAETVWLYCPLSPADFEKYPACQQKTGNTDFVIRIMTASMAAKLPTRDGPLGFAQYCPDDEHGCVANVFYPKVDELASQGGGRAARILGHAMAHEVGHLLLGANAHSSRGIMRGLWSPEDLRFMNWSYLLFTQGQSEQLRASLARRTGWKFPPMSSPGQL